MSECIICHGFVDRPFEVLSKTLKEAGLGNGNIHMNCFEIRLGRSLSFDDFTGATCNMNLGYEFLQIEKGDKLALLDRFKMGEKTQRTQITANYLILSGGKLFYLRDVSILECNDTQKLAKKLQGIKPLKNNETLHLGTVTFLSL